MRIVLLGAPGSGKGTQSKLLTKAFDIPQISTGDILRAAVTARTRLGLQAKAAMDLGRLVSDDIVLAMVKDRLQEPDTKNGFILDGFPRNIPQAKALDVVLDKINKPIQIALLIDVDFDVLLQRLTGRRTCQSCGQMYNIYTSPSKLDTQCDRCGGNLKHRADDNEETIGNRLRIYETQTEPLMAYYQEQEIQRTVQGIGEIKTIFKGVQKLLENLPKRKKVAIKKPVGRKALTPDDTTEVAASKIAAKLIENANKKALKKAKKKANKPKKKTSATTTKKTANKKKVAVKKTVKQSAVKKKPAVKKK